LVTCHNRATPPLLAVGQGWQRRAGFAGFPALHWLPNTIIVSGTIL